VVVEQVDLVDIEKVAIRFGQYARLESTRIVSATCSRSCATRARKMSRLPPGK